MQNEDISKMVPLRVGEIGVLQHMNRQALNGLIAEVTGELKIRMLYNLIHPADSETCLAYKVAVPGHPSPHERIEWCVKAHQLRRIDGQETEIRSQVEEKCY